MSFCHYKLIQVLLPLTTEHKLLDVWQGNKYSSLSSPEIQSTCLQTSFAIYCFFFLVVLN